MDVFNHFSCYTKLPVLLEHVIEHILETQVVASIDIYALDLDPDFLQGFCWVYEDRPHNSINHHLRAKIGYSVHLPNEMARLVVCKELIHLLDNHMETAQTAAQVDTLIEEIVLPPEAAVAMIAESDKRGILLALAVLLPRDTIDELRPKVEAGEVSIKTIAKHARLPEAFVRVAFSSLWKPVIDGFSLKYPAQRDPQLNL